MAVLLQNGAGETLSPDDKDGFSIFLQLVYQRNKIAVAAHNGERVYVIVRERHLQRVKREIDIRAVLVASGRGHTLHHLDGAFGHLPCGKLLASPVRISELRDQVAPFL